MIEGEVEVTADGATYTLRPGDAFWTGVGTIHAFVSRTSSRVRWLETQSPQPPARHSYRFDRDWDYLRKVLKSALRTDMRPPWRSRDSWHFYRNSFAAWNLTGWEALEAAALAGQTSFTVRPKQVVFEMDPRLRVAPKLEAFPR